MHINESGGILTVEEFWDCECEIDFIQRKTVHGHCNACGFSHDEMPDSRLSEILIYYPELLTKEERLQAIKEYMDRAGLVG